MCHRIAPLVGVADVVVWQVKNRPRFATKNDDTPIRGIKDQERPRTTPGASRFLKSCHTQQATSYTFDSAQELIELHACDPACCERCFTPANQAPRRFSHPRR